MTNPEQFMAELKLVFDWRDELVGRMQRGQCLLETNGLSPEIHDALIAEARAFIATCRAVTERIPGSLAARQLLADEEEQAA